MTVPHRKVCHGQLEESLTCEVIGDLDSDENEQTVKDMEPQFKVPGQKLITRLINFSIFSSHKGADLIE